MISQSRFSVLRSLLLLCAAVCAASVVSAASWPPISEEERNATECPSDPDAGAEVLYKSIEIDNENPTNSYIERFLRIKIYNEKGAEKVAAFRMVYDSEGFKLGLHRARVVRADGSEEEVEKSEFYEVDLKRERSGSIKAKKFIFPDLNPGDIIDFKYRLDLYDYYYQPELFVTFQEEWPLRKASVRVRPASWLEEAGSAKGGYVKWITSKCEAKGMKKKADGFYELEVGNFPASVEEPYQPPEKTKMAWLLFYLSGDSRMGDDYWKVESKKLYRQMESSTKAGKNVKATLQSIVKNGMGEEEKLKAIYNYCVSELINSVHGLPGQLTPEEREKIDLNMDAEKILEQGYGSLRNINTAFCALARAAGFDARVAAVSSRTGYSFSKTLVSMKTTMKRRCVAIKLGDQWRYFDPGGKYVAFGQMDWQEQGVAALISDKKDLIIEPVAFSSYEDTIEKNTAKLTLSEDGSLTGDVEIQLSGHLGVEMKRVLDGLSDQEREKYIRGQMKDVWPDSQIRGIEVENAADPLNPLRVKFRLVSESYGEVVGDRIFLLVNVFRKNDEPAFPERSRSSDLFFEYAFSEIDEVQIQLPQGYGLEAASAPRPFEVKKIFEYEPRLAFNSKTNTLIYSKSCRMGGSFFPVKHYDQIKALYDEKHRQDQHTITLKKEAVEVSAR